MSEYLWASLGIVLIIEGIGPMLFPKRWRKTIIQMANLPDRLLSRFGGCLVISGVVLLYWMWSVMWTFE